MNELTSHQSVARAGATGRRFLPGMGRDLLLPFYDPFTRLIGVESVGWPGASQPPAPTDPDVTVSRHPALLTSVSDWLYPLPLGE